MATPKVGGEVDTLCGRCKLLLSHTILALMGSRIARVRCNTCGSDHAYRPGTERAGRAAQSGTHRSSERVVISYADKLAAQDPSQATPYNSKTRYTADQLISHPTFGLGLVTAVREDKVDVAFKTFTKTLAHTRDASKPRAVPFKAPHVSIDVPSNTQENDDPSLEGG